MAFHRSADARPRRASAAARIRTRFAGGFGLLLVSIATFGSMAGVAYAGDRVFWNDGFLGAGGHYSDQTHHLSEVDVRLISGPSSGCANAWNPFPGPTGIGFAFVGQSACVNTNGGTAGHPYCACGDVRQAWVGPGGAAGATVRGHEY